MAADCKTARVGGPGDPFSEIRQREVWIRIRAPDGGMRWERRIVREIRQCSYDLYVVVCFEGLKADDVDALLKCAVATADDLGLKPSPDAESADVQEKLEEGTRRCGRDLPFVREKVGAVSGVYAALELASCEEWRVLEVVDELA